MVNEVNLALCLICHHGEWDDFRRDARVIQRVTFEKNIPITYCFSGIELNAIAEHRDSIHNELWLDLVGAIQEDYFINPRRGHYYAYNPEIAIMPFHHIPLAQPWGQDIWREYFEGILKDEIRWSQGIAEREFWKTAVTIHPPDGVYAPAAAYPLKELGLENVIVSGEFLGDDKHAKGILYWASGLRHVTRTNDLQPQDPAFSNASHFVDAIEAYGHDNDIGFVVVSCDIDEFNGTREMSLHDGIARLCCIGEEVYRRNGRVRMVNANAAAYWNLHCEKNIEKFWPWNDVHSQIDDGSLGFINSEKNGLIGHATWLIGERHREKWDGEKIQEAKDNLWRAADSACRNKYFEEGLSGYFKKNINNVGSLLEDERLSNYK